MIKGSLSPCSAIHRAVADVSRRRRVPVGASLKQPSQPPMDSRRRSSWVVGSWILETVVHEGQPPIVPSRTDAFRLLSSSEISCDALKIAGKDRMSPRQLGEG